LRVASFDSFRIQEWNIPVSSLVTETEPAVAPVEQCGAAGPALEAGLLTSAELAECTCPDLCERAHGND